MNSFGRILRTSIFGESHGKKTGILIDGCPPGICVEPDDFKDDLDRRRGGRPGTTSRAEKDQVYVESGVFNGFTTGAPILLEFKNNHIKSQDYNNLINRPRPGHSDFAAAVKYGGYNDYRGAGHFSGRLTVTLVAAGVIAKKILKEVKIEAKIIEAGGSEDFVYAAIEAEKTGNSIGGIVECTVSGVSAGLGEHFYDSVESLISHAMFAIPAIKAIEFGAGFKCARMHGSDFNDQIINTDGVTKTNNSGGINGGITNGNNIVFRVAVRPAASIKQRQQTVDLKTGEAVSVEVKGRHDACIALRIPVVVEAATALVLADLVLLHKKF